MSGETTSLLGFQFEPEKKPTNDEAELTYHSDESDEELLTEISDDVDKWCSCENCRNMPTKRECLCCRQIESLNFFNLEEIGCITKYEDFNSVVLLENTLWTALVALHDRESRGLTERSEVSNRSYRYAAYRQFTWFAHSRLGKSVRRVIPSCVVLKIREKFPSEDGKYVGFKDYDDDDSEITLSWDPRTSDSDN